LFLSFRELPKHSLSQHYFWRLLFFSFLSEAHCTIPTRLWSPFIFTSGQHRYFSQRFNDLRCSANLCPNVHRIPVAPATPIYTWHEIWMTTTPRRWLVSKLIRPNCCAVASYPRQIRWAYGLQSTVYDATEQQFVSILSLQSRTEPSFLSIFPSSNNIPSL
jgi:hypothetical protein